MEATLDALKILVCWQMIAGALCVQAIMQMLARMTNAVVPNWRQYGWFRAFVASQNLMWGVALAFVPDFLPGKAFFERAVLGVVAGFASHAVYKFFLKRFDLTSAKPKAQPSEAE